MLFRSIEPQLLPHTVQLCPRAAHCSVVSSCRTLVSCAVVPHTVQLRRRAAHCSVVPSCLNSFTPIVPRFDQLNNRYVNIDVIKLMTYGRASDRV